MAKEETEMVESREDDILTLVRRTEWLKANENLGRAKATLEEAKADIQSVEAMLRSMSYAVDEMLSRLGRTQ